MEDRLAELNSNCTKSLERRPGTRTWKDGSAVKIFEKRFEMNVRTPPVEESGPAEKKLRCLENCLENV